MLVIGHRGASGYAPENTLSAFDLAIEQGADGIECDIIQHGDEFFVFHDFRLDRTTNATGLLTQFSHEEIRYIDAGNGQRIPTLTSLVQNLASEKLCNLELKSVSNVKHFSDCLSDLLNRNHIPEENIIISSFHHGVLKQVHALNKRLDIAYLIAHYPEDVEQYFLSLPSHSVNVALDIIDANMVDIAHSLGKRVMVYTVNQVDDINMCKAIGADGIFTDYPLIAVQALYKL